MYTLSVSGKNARLSFLADHAQVTGQTERFMSSNRTVPLFSYGRAEFKIVLDHGIQFCRETSSHDN
jgi:hypothetical protein